MNVLVRPEKPLALQRRELSTLTIQYWMALTGLGLLIFVIAHMAGNLLIFSGWHALDNYADGLHSHPGLLWLARSILILLFGGHIFLAVKLTRRNVNARPVPYAYEKSIQTSWAARHMFLTGLLLLGFVVYHLLHFTFGVTDPSHYTSHLPLDPDGQANVAGMVVGGFAQWPVAIGYIVAMLFLGVHLSHGAWSMFQHFGFNRPSVQQYFYLFALVVALILTLGNISMPLAILCGYRPG
jgi:succinate dehydrogenase / fumarate reductase cytochrome b subunit